MKRIIGVCACPAGIRLRYHCGRYPCGNGALQREKASGGFCNRCREKSRKRI